MIEIRGGKLMNTVGEKMKKHSVIYDSRLHHKSDLWTDFIQRFCFMLALDEKMEASIHSSIQHII